jgi:hypothetical protein
VRRPGFLTLVMSVSLLSACSSGSAPAPVASPSEPALEAPPGPSLPACANAGSPVAAPSGFPIVFPLPPGAVVVQADQPAGGGSRITFVAPIEVDAFGQFLEEALPRAGFSIGGGEAEADELESKFSGAGLDGLLTAREISGCPGVLNVQVVVRPT